MKIFDKTLELENKNFKVIAFDNERYEKNNRKHLYYKIKCKACETSNEYLNLEIDFGKAITINLFDIGEVNVGDEIVFEKFINKELKWDK